MQFHHNGFRTGDPDVLPASALAAPNFDDPQRAMPLEVDVLIVGCGPAGLTLAAQLAAFPDIKVCIAERKPGPLELGQADGIACRTMEMFNAFGFAERVLRESYWVNETTFWRPNETAGSGIVRGGRILDTEPGLSEFPHVILNQARVHTFLLDKMRNASSRLVPHYARDLAELTVDRTEGVSHPVTARFTRTDPGHEGEIETVRARYAVGCDGARSTVRRELGLALKGESANRAWGVMDVLPVTNFPDIRLKCVINAPEGGTIVLIPREGGSLVRIYVEIDELEDGERAASRKMTVDDIIAAAKTSLQPYDFDVREVAWWSIYEIGQRLCDRFDDLGEDAGEDTIPHVFIAGDACHTHSPKAGQGMNVSIQDGFNLGWKLAAVLQGRSQPKLLRSYSQERQAIAGELIEFDKEWAAMLSSPLKDPNNPESEGIDPAEVQDYFVRHGHYTAGTATWYAPSKLIGTGEHQQLATGFKVGKRFHSAPVIRLGDAKPMQLGHAFEADGRWRAYVFAAADAPSATDNPLAKLCAFLSKSPASPIARHTPAGADIDSVIDLRAILPHRHRDVSLEDLPALLKPAKGPLGLQDYEKVFCIDDQAGDIFDLRGIDRQRGAIVIVRPDQQVANVLPIDGYDELVSFFAGFLIEVG